MCGAHPESWSDGLYDAIGFNSNPARYLIFLACRIKIFATFCDASFFV